MSDAALMVLKNNLKSFSSSLVWLRRSYDACKGIGIKDSYTPEEFDSFENLTSRYARTTDLLAGKLLRSIDAVELINSGSIIDAAHGAEKRGIIESVSELRDLKDLRNEIAHEYETEDLSAFFCEVLNAAGRLFAIADRALKYCEKYRVED
ncbi:MAG: hypothetical protein LBQ57_06825 [Spirochaetales bacterium]|jgi:hypothetical protein|nr:hypothetical protein [Spirochaetales bacterium]